MTRLLRLCGVACLALTASSCAPGLTGQVGEDKPDTVAVSYRGRQIEVIRGEEIWARFGEEVAESVRQRIIMDYGMFVRREMAYGYFVYRINILNPVRVESAVESLRGRPEVEEAQPNVPGGPSSLPL